MMSVFDIVIVFGSIAAGACLMRWHEIDKAQRVKQETDKAEGLRRENEQLRIKMATVNPQVVYMEEQCLAPMPMIFGITEEAELKQNGGFVRRRVGARA